jgi:predicted ester cyclase
MISVQPFQNIEKLKFMNKINQINTALEQLFEEGNIDIVECIFSKNYIAHHGDKTNSGQDFIKKFTKQLRKALPDLKIIKVEFLSQTNNMVTWQRSFSGTHTAAMKSIPASNKKIKWHEIVVSRFEDDKIVEEWLVSDLAFQMMLKQGR